MEKTCSFEIRFADMGICVDIFVLVVGGPVLPFAFNFVKSLVTSLSYHKSHAKRSWKIRFFKSFEPTNQSLFAYFLQPLFAFCLLTFTRANSYWGRSEKLGRVKVKNFNFKSYDQELLMFVSQATWQSPHCQNDNSLYDPSISPNIMMSLMPKSADQSKAPSQVQNLVGCNWCGF